MTIEKLARLIVDDWYDGSPNGEKYLIAVEQTTRELRRTYQMRDGNAFVLVEVDQ
jgi:hypothetical protein